MHKISATKTIKANYNCVYQSIWKIDSWANFWSPLHEVEILYDDGTHQDFVMTIAWQSTEARIRTVRFRNIKGDIFFFSPIPPPPTTIHQGMWQLKSHGEHKVQLTAVRWFELPTSQVETVLEYDQRVTKFSQEFQLRLETLLEKLGELCEK